jgi:hypothetical protein
MCLKKLVCWRGRGVMVKLFDLICRSSFEFILGSNSVLRWETFALWEGGWKERKEG